MDIASLIRDAWAATWRNRFLWVLALFAGGAAGVSTGGSGRNTNWQPNQAELDRVAPNVTRFGREFGEWAAAHTGLLVAAGLVAALVALTLLVVFFIAQGGMATATLELGTGHSTTLVQAWRAGLHFFWRYAGLWLMLALLAMAIAFITGLALALMAGFGVLTGTWVMSIAMLLAFGLPAIVIGLAVTIGLTIVVAYAQRAIAAEDTGPLGALTSAWTLLRGHVRQSLLAWVVSLGLAVVAGLAAGIVIVLAAGIVVLFGAMLWGLAGMGPALVLYGALGVLVVISLGLVLLAINNTFFWNYWTLTYLRISQAEPQA
jgi:hypothetical protein